MNEAAKFSILIPSWNNLDYVRLCFDSIKKNSRYQHQLILHINDGSDGTLQWAKDQGIDHTHSVDNIGICLALNQAASLAKTDYIVYMNDDMYVCPDWDLYLWEEISSLNHNQFFISSTMIEPTDTGNACVIGGKNFGTNTDEFREQDLLEQYASLPMNDWQGATWPPNIVHKSMWDLVGGYSIELSPGMYSDPDFSMKLWKCGVRYFKGLAKSRVYHFQCKSTGRKIQLNPGRKQFLSKWGMASSTFMREYLGIGKPFVGPIPNPDEN
ncbi:MAG: glycosyltransferase family 2 protein, partial [Gammaproteobacteria bacterium]|nr:glycosyltransferase family 2 protein [Gammaproteobacteria bacterium]